MCRSIYYYMKQVGPHIFNNIYYNNNDNILGIIYINTNNINIRFIFSYHELNRYDFLIRINNISVNICTWYVYFIFHVVHTYQHTIEVLFDLIIYIYTHLFLSIVY